mmetsp:Transcript_26371/g.35196  ORF Transcript_26371/g.35196 Transcript_26371/m.35196 type:complete len:84 (-) Transcript_26371:698-949(-)
MVNPDPNLTKIHNGSYIQINREQMKTLLEMKAKKHPQKTGNISWGLRIVTALLLLNLMDVHCCHNVPGCLDLALDLISNHHKI